MGGGDGRLTRLMLEIEQLLFASMTMALTNDETWQLEFVSFGQK